MSALESARVRRIMKGLNARPGCVAFKYHGSAYGVVGHPDIYGCDNGRAFVFEAKQPKRKLEAVQASQLRKWEAAGAVAGRVETLEDCIELLEGA